jgi:hypothetical protein
MTCVDIVGLALAVFGILLVVPTMVSWTTARLKFCAALCGFAVAVGIVFLPVASTSGVLCGSIVKHESDPSPTTEYPRGTSELDRYQDTYQSTGPCEDARNEALAVAALLAVPCLIGLIGYGVAVRRQGSD